MKNEPKPMPPKYGPPLTEKERDQLHKNNLIELQDILAKEIGALKRIIESGRWSPYVRTEAGKVLGFLKQEYLEVENDIDGLRRL